MSADFPIVAIVDDDIAARRALARMLASQGYRVKQFASAQQYLVAAEANEAFCALIDIHLGEDMSGLELGRAIRASVCAIPLIFMTGCADEILRAQAEDLGCICLLDKPCRAEHVLVAIQRARATG